jgi:hypothetical protein
VAKDEFSQMAEKQIRHMDDINLDDDEVNILLENIVADVFKHDQNNDGLDLE